jgi:hypothetical protein
MTGNGSRRCIAFEVARAETRRTDFDAIDRGTHERSAIEEADESLGRGPEKATDENNETLRH